MPKHLVISTSGNPDSNSRRMGRAAFAHLQKKKLDCDWRIELLMRLACFQCAVSLRLPNIFSAGTNAPRHITITAIQITNSRLIPVTETDSTENVPTKP